MVEPSPKGAKPLQRLKPRAHGNDKIIIITALISTAFFLEEPKRAMAKERIFSNTAIIVDKEAKTIKIKNVMPQSCDSGIELNIFGSVINTRLGPLSGLTPNEKQAGKIIKPDIIATKVSRIVMFMLSPNKLRSFGK